MVFECLASQELIRDNAWFKQELEKERAARAADALAFERNYQELRSLVKLSETPAVQDHPAGQVT